MYSYGKTLIHFLNNLFYGYPVHFGFGSTVPSLTYRCLWLLWLITERAYAPPTATGRPTLLFWHPWDLNSRSPGHRANAFLLAPWDSTTLVWCGIWSIGATWLMQLTCDGSHDYWLWTLHLCNRNIPAIVDIPKVTPMDSSIWVPCECTRIVPIITCTQLVHNIPVGVM